MVDMSIFGGTFDMFHGLVDRIDDSLHLVSQGLIGQPVLYLSRAIRLLQALTGRAVRERCPSASSHELVSPLFERITRTTNLSWSRMAPRARRTGRHRLQQHHAPTLRGGTLPGAGLLGDPPAVGLRHARRGGPGRCSSHGAWRSRRPMWLRGSGWISLQSRVKGDH
jgi:hypothetical protein